MQAIDLMKMPLELKQTLSDRLEDTITLEQTSQLMEASTLADTKFTRSGVWESLTDRLHALNFNLNGATFKEVKQEHLPLQEAFIVRLIIANFFQNEPHNLPMNILELIGTLRSQ